MGPSSLDVDAKKVDVRTLFTVWIQYMRAKHAIDVAEVSLYSIAYGIGVSAGEELDALERELRLECARISGCAVEEAVPVAAGGSTAGPSAPQPGSSGSGPGGLPAADAAADATAADPRAGPSLREAAAARASGPWPPGAPGASGGFSQDVRFGVPVGRPLADPCAQCSVCAASADDPDYKVSSTGDGCVALKQLKGTARSSKLDPHCIHTFIGAVSDRCEADALSGRPLPPEPPCLMGCSTRYSSVVAAPRPPPLPGTPPSRWSSPRAASTAC